MAARPFCPVGCGRSKDAGHVMCRTCWYRVPAELRAQVWATWRAFNAGAGGSEDWDAYIDARRAAITAAGSAV